MKNELKWIPQQIYSMREIDKHREENTKKGAKGSMKGRKGQKSGDKRVVEARPTMIQEQLVPTKERKWKGQRKRNGKYNQ